MIKQMILGALGLVFMSSLAYASDPSQFPHGFYFTGQVTNSWANSPGLSYTDLNYTGINANLNVKNDMGIGGRLGMGFAFNRVLAIESGYSFMPDLTLIAKTTNLNPQVSASGNVNMSDVDVLLRLMIPIDKFFIYAKGGGAYVMLNTNNQVTLNIAGNNIGSVVVPNDLTSYNSWLPEAVVGTGYAFNRHITVDASYGRIFGLGGLQGENAIPNVDTAALGLSYYF